MLERVAIILNEREPLKKALAEQLASQLLTIHISSRRYSISETLFDELVTRSPSVVVTDYVLGDLTTGLDLLDRVKSRSEQWKPDWYFMTDESSSLVAIEALKLGAQDFFNLTHPQAVQSCIDAISHAVAQATRSSPRLPPAITLESMIQTAPASIELRHKLQALALALPEACILRGPLGCGLATYAQALFTASKQQPLAFECIDLKRDRRPIQEILSRIHVSHSVKGARGLICTGVEEDPHFLAALRSVVAKSKQRTALTHLCLCTNDQAFAQALQAEIKAPLLTVPSLAERRGDVPGLIDTWISALKIAVPRAFQAPGRDDVALLQQLDWPGNLAQLRAIVSASIADISREDFAVRIERLRELYAQPPQPPKKEISPVKLWQSLRQTHFDVRATAVHLGVPTSQVREMLYGD